MKALEELLLLYPSKASDVRVILCNYVGAASMQKLLLPSALDKEMEFCHFFFGFLVSACNYWYFVSFFSYP